MRFLFLSIKLSIFFVLFACGGGSGGSVGTSNSTSSTLFSSDFYKVASYDLKGSYSNGVKAEGSFEFESIDIKSADGVDYYEISQVFNIDSNAVNLGSSSYEYYDVPVGLPGTPSKYGIPDFYKAGDSGEFEDKENATYLTKRTWKTEANGSDLLDIIITIKENSKLPNTESIYYTYTYTIDTSGYISSVKIVVEYKSSGLTLTFSSN